MRSENDPGSRRITRREFNADLLVGALALSTASVGAWNLHQRLYQTEQETPLLPPINDQEFLEAYLYYSAIFSLHEADEEIKKTKLVFNNPELYIPEINATSHGREMYSAHYSSDVASMNPTLREEKKLKTRTIK